MDENRYQTNWPVPKIVPTLEKSAVHLWRVNLAPPAAEVSELTHLLSPDELQHMGRFHFERHRRAYAVSHGALRLLLGRYLGRPPETLRFESGQHGKPSLAGSDAIQFNLSHSHEMGLVGFHSSRPLGVDIEWQREMEDLGKIARRFFSFSEYEVWRQVQPEQQVQAFFNCWTRKEAFIKAIGDGLTHPLDSFIVTLAPGEAVRFLSIDGSREKAKGWWLQAFDPDPDYAAALAIPMPRPEASCFHFSPNL